MTALKARDVERFCTEPDLQRGIILVYGPDTGRVRETGRRLLARYAGESPDPMAEVTLDLDTLRTEPGRLAVEAGTPPLFGGRRMVRVRAASAVIAPELEEIAGNPPDAIIVIEAANLVPRDKLRLLVERSRHGRTLPCYADDDKSLSDLIRTTFKDHGISAGQDVVPALRTILGNDREITRRELEKLTLFAAQSKKLTLDDVVTLCGDNAMLAVDRLVDAVGTGHVSKFDEAFARAQSSGTKPDRILAIALQHFLALRHMRAQVDAGHTARTVVTGRDLRVHFSRVEAITQQVRLWTDTALANATARLFSAITRTRKSTGLDEAIAHRTLLALCLIGARK